MYRQKENILPVFFLSLKSQDLKTKSLSALSCLVLSYPTYLTYLPYLLPNLPTLPTLLTRLILDPIQHADMHVS